MTLSYKFGEFGETHPIQCVDSNDQDINIAFADATKSKIFIMSENKTKLILTITDADFVIVSPNVNWTPTKDQFETLSPGNYSGEVHLQDLGVTRLTICEFALFVEKAKGNIV